MRSLTTNIFITTFLVLCQTLSATASTSAGKIDIYSDNNCKDLILTQSGSIPLDTCLSPVNSPSGDPALAFLVSEKPFCPNGKRPSLLLYQDLCCTDGVANYIPFASYGDYGNGSCQPLLGGNFVAFVFQCGGFDDPIRSVISFSFPRPTTSSFTGCAGPTLHAGDAVASSTRTSTSGVSGSTSLPQSAQATTPTSGSGPASVSATKTGAAAAANTTAAKTTASLATRSYLSDSLANVLLVGALGLLAIIAL